MRKTNANPNPCATTRGPRVVGEMPTTRAIPATLAVREAAASLATLATFAALAIFSALAIDFAVAQAAKPSAVTYFRAETVTNSFEKGAVLYHGDENYMIHTSRRTAPGMAEVHAEDTDLIYVLQGEATFVTGGRVIEGKETAPGEVRGASIQGGETRTLSPGDVVIVPNNVPHWFKDVRGPLHYYTIKVR